MKKILFTLMVIIIATAANAQVASGGFRRGGTNAQIKAMQKQKLKDSLGISEGTAKSVDAIQQDYMLRMRAVKMNSQLSDEERKSQLKAIQEERREKLRAVLTERQLAKMDGETKVKKPIKKKKYSSNKNKKKSVKKRQS